MGVDFHIDNKPKVKWRKTKGLDCTEWSTEIYELESLIESAKYDVFDSDVGTYEFEIAPADEIQRTAEDPRWSYSGFGRAREAVASAVGIDLEMMYGFKPSSIRIFEKRTGLKWLASMPGFDSEFEEQWWSDNCTHWSEIDHPLVPFLDHSDCDGELTPEQCAAVGPALREILDKLPSDFLRDYDKQQLELFAGLCDDCVKYNKDLIFC